MLIRKTGKLTIVFAMFATMLTAVSNGQAAPIRGSIPFASPAFQQVWARTDQLIATGKVQRGYFWGSLPNTPGIMEDFADAPGGKRLVQYFDKSRMEINDPNADKSSKFYVTNGLLATELLTGKMQIGNNSFVDLGAPTIPLASDPDDATAPTYASFGDVLNFAPITKTGQLANQPFKLDEASNKALLTHYGSFNVRYAYNEPTTGYSIPDVFWDYLNASGSVLVNGQQVTARLSDPYFYATGYPISNAYWVRVKIAGKPNTDVLIQAYQRRILTYVPSAPDGYKVQMGNIGQHYYQWRYGNDPAHPVDFLTRCGSSLSGVGDSFSRLWAKYPDLHQKLLCPTPADYNAHFTNGPTVQSFEHGQMVSLIFSNLSNGAKSKYIFVLFDDGSVQRFDDTFVDGTPEPPSNPPAGRYAPQFGFGKLWREHPDISSKLGWATTHERRLYLGEYAFTAQGLLLANALDLTKVIALYGNADLGYSAWQSVDVGAPPALTDCSTISGFTSTAFGHLWSISTQIQQQLGCPLPQTGSNAPQLQLALQQFQHGEILYVDHLNPPQKMSISPIEYYALLDDGTLISSVSNYEPTAPPDPGNPPAGLYPPGDKFSAFWRQSARVQQELGWATAPQQDLSSADYYAFSRGILWRANGEFRYIFSVDFFYFLYSELWGSWAE